MKHRPVPATVFAVLAALAVLAWTGCGYHVVGTEPQLPADIRSIAVGEILNDTRLRGLEKDLQFAWEREILVRRHYRMAESKDDADAVITARIRDLSRRSVAWDENDQAMQYEIQILLDIVLVRRAGGEVLWESRNVRRIDEYASNPRVAITSSSEFQQGTLDAKDVPRQPNDGIADSRQIGFIQLAESESRHATQRLLRSVVRDTYNRMIEGF